MSGEEFPRRCDAGEYDGIEEDEFGRRVLQLERSFPSRVGRRVVQRGQADDLEALQVCATCVVRQPLWFSPSSRDLTGGWVASFDKPAPLRGQGILRGSFVSVRCAIGTPDARSGATVAGHDYLLLDHAGRDLLAFHWHPVGRSRVGFRRLHLSAALRGTAPSGEATILPLEKVHVPTGFVSVAEVVRLLIAEFGVSPVVGNWQGRLERAAGMLPAFPT